MNIGILTIATGKYTCFIDYLWSTITSKFLVDDGFNKRFFLWTDAVNKCPSGFDSVVIQKECLGFPGDTMFRYHFFKKAAIDGYFDDIDYLFYFDADMMVENIVSAKGDLDPLFAQNRDIAVVTHPGYTWNGRIGTFETRRASSAFVDPFSIRRTPYVAGGFLGGKTKSFLDMAQAIVELVDKDTKCGITAVWHDESYLNAFVARQKTKPLVLHPGYCYPENCYGNSMEIPFRRYIIALEKDLKEYQG